MAMDALRQADPEVWQAVEAERRRQQDGLEMIASENYTSPAVLAAQGSVLTNKYAEGYPGRRYYGGCEYVDIVERLASERVCKLFGAEHANVQPHSGAQANMGVYFACLEPGDTLLAMNLAHGGHLTHGMHLNFSGKLYRVVHYGVRKDTEKIDVHQGARRARVNQAVFPGMQGGPLMHVVAAKAIAFREAAEPAFRSYAAQVIANARTLAHELRASGFRLVSGGTDNHLVLVDVTSRGLTGKL